MLIVSIVSNNIQLTLLCLIHYLTLIGGFFFFFYEDLYRFTEIQSFYSCSFIRFSFNPFFFFFFFFFFS